MKQQYWDNIKEIWVVEKDSQFQEYPTKKIVGVFASISEAEKHANAKKGHTVRHFVLEGVYAPNGLRLIS